MGYELRRQLREALGPDITGLQRAVALEIADDANERTRRSSVRWKIWCGGPAPRTASVVRNALKRLAARDGSSEFPIGKGKDGRELVRRPRHPDDVRSCPKFEGGAGATPSEPRRGSRGYPKGEQGLPLQPPKGEQGLIQKEPRLTQKEPWLPPLLRLLRLLMHELGERVEDSTYGIPDAARPLVDASAPAGVIVRWPFKGNQWFPILALITKCGVPALVDHARRRPPHAPTSTPPATSCAAGANSRHCPPGASPLLRSVPTARSTTDQRVAQGQALAAMFREQEQRAIEPRREDQEPA
jgi:hypothetical protein